MSIASWEVPFWLSTPQGTLNLNTEVTMPTAGDGIYILDPKACKCEIPLRVTDTNIPQADGEQLHSRFYQGYLLTLAIQYWDTEDAPACNELLQEMVDTLMRFIRSYTCATDARVYWTPDGEADRFIKAALLNDPADHSLGDGGIFQTVFQVKSPYPYAWDSAEITTVLPDTLTNTGSADFWPVIRVYGPTSGFIITNSSVLDSDGHPLQISYDAGLPGAIAISAGDFAEIDTFRNTIYLNGFQNNLKPGLNMGISDFFPIAVGANTITYSGSGTAQVLWQAAWA